MSTPKSDMNAGKRAAARYKLAVPRTLTSGPGGVRPGRRLGSSMEFQEYREYRPGDDLRHLDWSAYARSDRLVVKLFHQEVEPHLDLVIDGSRSMSPVDGTCRSTKGSATVGLAGFLDQAATHAGYSCANWLLAEGCRQMELGVDQIRFDFLGSFRESVTLLPPKWRPRGLRILVSDLLWGEPPRAILSRLAQNAAAVVVVQLLSLDDLQPSTRGFERLIDAETGESRDLLVDAALMHDYVGALAELQQTWRDACREAGAVMVTLVAEQLLDGWPPEVFRELVELEVLELQ